jgi:hypothetical protein
VAGVVWNMKLCIRWHLVWKGIKRFALLAALVGLPLWVLVACAVVLSVTFVTEIDLRIFSYKPRILDSRLVPIRLVFIITRYIIHLYFMTQKYVLERLRKFSGKRCMKNFKILVVVLSRQMQYRRFQNLKPKLNLCLNS